MIYDSHCHLDLMDNMTSMIKEITKTDIGLFAVGTTPKSYNKSIELCRNISNIKVGLGFHPQLISSGYDDIELFERIIPNCHYIGEIGLDYSPNYIQTRNKQVLMFERIIKICENQGDKIISIHSLKSVNDIISIIEKNKYNDSNKYIFHWFTGSISQLKRLLKLDCFFSINSRMLKTKSGSEILKNLPAEKILLETDAPFTKKFSLIADLRRELNALSKEISMISGVDIYKTININQNDIFKY